MEKVEWISTIKETEWSSWTVSYEKDRMVNAWICSDDVVVSYRPRMFSDDNCESCNLSHETVGRWDVT